MAHISSIYRTGIAVGALLAAIAAGWYFSRPTIDRARTYRIGYGQDAPMHFKGADGEPSGLAVELVREAARRAGLKLEWVEGEYTDLENGRLDMWVLLTIIPERRKIVHFTEPYLQTQSCLIVRDDSPYRELGDLSHARVGYNRHIVVRDALAKLLPGAEQVATLSSEAAIDDLNAGRVDAALVDEYMVVSDSLRGRPHDRFRLLPTRSPRRYLAIGSSFATAAAADELRRGMQAMAEDGRLTTVINRWTFFANPVTDTIGELAGAKRRERWLVAGLSMLLVVTAVTIFLAIWSHRQAAKLLRTENFLRDIADQVPGVVFQYRRNADGTSAFPFASEGIRQIFRVSPEAVRLDATSALAAVHPDDREAMQHSIRVSAETLGPWLHEFRVQFDDGVLHWLIGNAVPHRANDGATVWHGVITDITERKTAEAALQKIERKLHETQKLESLGVLAGGIAHDFNNILTAIIGNAELARMEISPRHPAADPLLQLYKASQRAREIVKQILTYSRKRTTERVPIDLRDIVREMDGLLRVSIPANVEIRLRLPESGTFVLADATQLHQVLLNLATNAAHAMDGKGGVLGIGLETIEVDERTADLRPELKAGRYVALAVSDSGCGMSPELIGRIFEPYFTTKEQGKGTGLGLSVVYGIVQEHGATITVDSLPGEGTVFRIYFPAQEARSVKRAPDLGLQRGNGERIVVVDDNPMVLQVASSLLPKIGYAATVFDNPAAALEALRQGASEPDVLITDLMMPGMSGLEFAAEVRRLRADLPIIVCTGFGGGLGEKDCRQRGLLGPLQKPFAAATLAALLATALGRPEAQASVPQAQPG